MKPPLIIDITNLNLPFLLTNEQHGYALTLTEPAQSTATAFECSLVSEAVDSSTLIRAISSFECTFQTQTEEREVFSSSIRDPRVELEVLSCFDCSNLEEIGDGMTIRLGKNITSVVEKYSSSAIDVLAAIVSSENPPAEVLSHVLRWLGRMKHPTSFRKRLWLLRLSLRSPSAVIRDGAALGLAALGSRLAIPSLRAAIERERIPSLRSDLQQVLIQLVLER
jgi:hypothetical protein